MVKQTSSSEEYIQSLNMNGLQGRMLRMPAPKGKKRELLMIYGHHSTLERWFGLSQVLNSYGAVTMPDLPGFGGMESFYKIGQEPTLDNMADYLASFIKMRYKRKRVTIVGMSYGFIVATRMLQRFPDIAKRVDILVSLVGFAHKDDFMFKPALYWSYRAIARVFALPVTSTMWRGICLHPWVLRMVYTKMDHAKFKGLTPEQDEQMLQVEIDLWRNNDVRTYMRTTTTMLTFDNCNAQVDLPVWHVGVANDHFLSGALVEQHMRVIFTDFIGMSLDLEKHAPTVIASAKDAAPYIPQRLRRVLSQQ